MSVDAEIASFALRHGKARGIERATAQGLVRILLERWRVGQRRWENEAVRIVEVQRRTQAIVPALLQAVTIGSRAFVLRELMPT